MSGACGDPCGGLAGGPDQLRMSALLVMEGGPGLVNRGSLSTCAQLDQRGALMCSAGPFITSHEIVRRVLSSVARFEKTDAICRSIDLYHGRHQRHRRAGTSIRPGACLAQTDSPRSLFAQFTSKRSERWSPLTTS